MTGQLGGQVADRRAAPRTAPICRRSPGSSPTRSTRLGVHVHLRTPVDPDLVVEQHPTRSSSPPVPRPGAAASSCPARRGRCPAATLPHVFTVWDVLGFGGRATLGTTAVVYDDTGDVRGHLRRGRARRRRCHGDGRQPPRAARGQRALPAGHGRGQPGAAARCRRRSSSRRWPCRRSRPTRSSCEASATTCVGTFPADTVVIATYHEPNAELADHLRDAGTDRARRRQRHRHRHHPGRHPWRRGDLPNDLRRETWTLRCRNG